MDGPQHNGIRIVSRSDWNQHHWKLPDLAFESAFFLPLPHDRVGVAQALQSFTSERGIARLHLRDWNSRMYQPNHPVDIHHAIHQLGSDVVFRHRSEEHT